MTPPGTTPPATGTRSTTSAATIRTPSTPSTASPASGSRDEADFYQYDAEGNRTATYHWTDDDDDDQVDWNADEISDWTEYTWDPPQPPNPSRIRRRLRHHRRHGDLRLRLAQPLDFNRRRLRHRHGNLRTFVYGGATFPDEVTPWDRAATNLRDIGQITLRLEGNRDFTAGKETADIANRYLWGAAVDQVLADEQVEWNATAEDYDIEQILWPLADHQGTTRDLAELLDDGTTKVVQQKTYDATATSWPSANGTRIPKPSSSPPPPPSPISSASPPARIKPTRAFKTTSEGGMIRKSQVGQVKTRLVSEEVTQTYIATAGMTR